MRLMPAEESIPPTRYQAVTGSTPQLGLNMHPRWVGDGQPEDFLLPLKKLGLSVLEFRADLSSPEWPDVCSLIEECRRLGFELAFHAPYTGPYSATGFSGADRDRIERLYRPAIEYAARMAEQAGSTILVLHGAKGDRPRQELRRDTEAFVAWILEEAPGLCPCIELLVRGQDTVKIGDNKVELVEIVSELGSPRVGICWDLGHDVRNGLLAAPPGFRALVRHVHLHDIAPDGQDHCPLLFGTVPYADYMRQLRQAGYGGAIVLEVGGDLVARFAAMNGMHPAQILQDNLIAVAAAY